MTQLRNLTYDFIRRTKANLETIERLAKEDKDRHFEVTQLINSCLGMLFIPTEDQIDSLKEQSIDSFLRNIGSPKVLHGKLKSDNAAGLFRYLRNAFAHLNFDFEYANNVIIGVYVWNNKERDVTDWVAYVHVDQLRQMLAKLADFYLSVIPQNEVNSSSLAQVEKRIGTSLRIINKAEQ